MFSLHGNARKVHSGRCADITRLWLLAQASIVRLLESRGGSTALDFGEARPGVLLIVGVNGGGKTTTIGKLAHKFVGEGATVRWRSATASGLGRAITSVPDLQRGRRRPAGERTLSALKS